MTGVFASNAIVYVIILTTATLYAHGQTSRATVREAVQALRPVASAGPYWLVTLGMNSPTELPVDRKATNQLARSSSSVAR